MKIMKRPFSIWLYVFIVFALTWPFQLWYVFKAHSAFDRYAYSSLPMVMVAVATVIAARFVFKDGLAGAGYHWGKPVHYVCVVLFALLNWLVPSMIELLSGMHKPIAHVVAADIFLNFLLRFGGTLLPAFGEEFGWRGYMLPRLAAQYGARKGLLLHAFIWWFWHLPVIVGLGLKTNDLTSVPSANVALLILITIIPSMLHAVIFAFIWAKTKSLAVSTVYHAAFDEVRDALEKSVGFGPLVNLWQMAVVIIAGGLLLRKANWNSLLGNEAFLRLAVDGKFIVN